MGTRRYLFAALLAGLIVIVVVIAVTPLGTPRPQPASAPATAFSADRAMDTMRVVAARPRPIGSGAAGSVRDYLYERLAHLGLGPHVQTAEIVSAHDPRVAGTVYNVAGRLPGRDPSRAVLLVAHYDSVPTAPGAADDASGVATLLEVARALRSGPPPRNDVIFLFTDGEERGLLGIQAFLRDDAWAFAAGVALNVDSPGTSSPLLMYETSPGNGLLVRRYAEATRPYTSSLMYEVARRQPIVTDFRPLLARGIPGLSFGMLDGPAFDHTAYDSLANVDESSLQQSGDTVLAVARRFADLDLWRVHEADVVSFDLIGGIAVVYAGSLVPGFAGLAVALYAAAVAVALRRRLLTLRGVLWSALGSAVTLGASLLVMMVVWTMYRTAYEERLWSDTGVVISDWYRVGLVLLAAAVVLAAYALLLRRLRPWDLAVVALAWWAVGTGVVSALVPGASFLLAWPLAAASVGFAVAAAITRRRAASSGDVAEEPGADAGRPGADPGRPGPRTAASSGAETTAAAQTVPPVARPSRPRDVPGAAVALVATAGAVPGLVLMSSATYLLLMSAGLKQVVTVTAVWMLLGLLALPLAVVVRAFRLWLPLALAVAGAVVLFAVGSNVAFDSEHPKFTSVYYRVEPDGSAVWQTVDPLDAYTKTFLAERLRSPFLAAYFPQMGSRDTLVGGAPSLGLPAPALRVLSDKTDGDRRTVRLRLRSRRGAAVLSLLVHTVVGNLTASVDGRPLAGRDTTLLDGTTVRWSFDYYAPPPQGVVVVLRFAAGPAVLLRAVDFSYGLPAAAAALYPARPAGMLPGRLGDGALAETLVRLPKSGG